MKELLCEPMCLETKNDSKVTDVNKPKFSFWDVNYETIHSFFNRFDWQRKYTTKK